jgi:hypothetical protein
MNIEDRIYDSRDEFKSQIDKLVKRELKNIKLPLQPLNNIIDELKTYGFETPDNDNNYYLDCIRMEFYQENTYSDEVIVGLTANLLRDNYIYLYGRD